MHTVPTTISSFPSNIAKRYCEMKSRSQYCRLPGKFQNDMTLSSKRSDVTETTSIYLQASLQNTVDQTSFAYLNQSLHVSSSKNFPGLNKSCGKESSGVMVSTLQPSASEVIGQQSNDMLQSKGKRWEIPHNLDYSPKASLQLYPVGLPRGN